MKIAPPDRLFWACVAAFVAIFAAFYPSTYAIEDEFNILSLATAISRGTVFLDRAGLDLDADLVWRGHIISKYSPFHAALLTPAIVANWHLAFAVTALFAVGGAFVFRGMLRRDGLPAGWVALYFLCAGLLFYSRTVMAAVPSAVMGLVGASYLLRERSNAAAGGAALGAAGLLHPWMIPVSGALVTGWWLDAPRARWRQLLLVVAAAAPGAAALLYYNWLTTGSPFRNVYSLVGTQSGFGGEHLATFLPLYAVSLLVMPLGGWAALSPRWSRGLAVPVAVVTVVAMASLYYYRDGLDYGVAGLLPAQRFLLPASLLACLPAARFLSDRTARIGGAPALTRWAPAAALTAFVGGFALVSAGHGAYLNAHASLQAALRSSIPDGSRVLVGERAFKEFAPVIGTWTLRQMHGDRVPAAPERDGAYEVWLGAPGQTPPQGWFSDRAPARVEVRSWVWNRDAWIGAPAAAARRASGADAKGLD
jgi:hypothetical protein